MRLLAMNRGLVQAAGCLLLVFVLGVTACNAPGVRPSRAPVRTVGGVPLATRTVVQPTVAPTSEAPVVQAKAAADVRSGPGTNYDALGKLDAGAVAQVVGRSPDGAWWAVPFAGAPDNQGWVSGDAVTPNTSAAAWPPGGQPLPQNALPTSSGSYAAPVLSEPEPDAAYLGRNAVIELSWVPVGTLGPGECYRIQLTQKLGPYDSPCVTATSWTVPDWLFDYRPADAQRTLSWKVRVVNASGAPLSDWSETRKFHWYDE